EANSVPAVTGKNIGDVQKLLSDKGFETVIQDSVYYDSLPPGVVIRQVPEGDQVVKVNRTVYVTINRFIPPDITMPNLIGFSLRNAEMQLHNLGLKLGDTTFKPDFAKNSVLEQTLGGNSIKAGDKVKVGSSISLVLGSGLGNEEMMVPKLIGLTFEEAKAYLDAQGLSLGAVITDPSVHDISNSFVYWQSPTSRTSDGKQVRIRPGQMIDLRLSLEKPPTDSLNQINQPPLIPQQEQQ
ncbi:MAG TPA: PASTA domain-containing protein, partial [Flavisolibacter sp.]|nr:PASTA domain-containing protein [Flavisolibacter sp.]